MDLRALTPFVTRAAGLVAALATGAVAADHVRFDGGLPSDLYFTSGGYSELPAGPASGDVVAVAVPESRDGELSVLVWYADGTMSEGSVDELDLHEGPKAVGYPAGLGPADVVGIAAGSDPERLVAWYSNGTYSVGTATELARHREPAPYAVPSCVSVESIVGIGLGGEPERVIAWYSDGTYSEGTEWQLDAHAPRQAYVGPPGSVTLGAAISNARDDAVVWSQGDVAAGVKYMCCKPGGSDDECFWADEDTNCMSWIKYECDCDGSNGCLCESCEPGCEGDTLPPIS